MPSTAGYPGPGRADPDLAWLPRLRWAGLGTYSLLLGLGLWSGYEPISLPPFLAILALMALSNFALPWLKAGGGAVLVFDTLLMTSLLALSGGPANPFTALYLVHVTLAAVALGPRWAWGIAGLSAIAFGSLFLVPSAGHHHEGFGGHLLGMWVAMAIAAGFMAHFAGRLMLDLRDREREVAGLRERAARQEKLASLITLAAGVAHVMATPLGTIAVAVGELQHSLEGLADPELLEDARLIRREVERCKASLRELGEHSGESPGESSAPVDWAVLQLEIKESFGDRLEVEHDPDLPAALLPRRALLKALESLVTNAMAAGSGPVKLQFRVVGATLELSVKDSGAGMEPEVLAQATEPFFTTKTPGMGMGLGLFLAREFADRLGGELRLASAPGRGTTATLCLPAELR